VDILFGLGSERELDRKLDELVAPILQGIHTEPAEPEFEQLVRTLRLVRGPDPRDVNARCLRNGDGSVLIHVGRGLYDFLQFYVRCVSTKFLPAQPGGPRPSPAWSVALPALASCLEWLALPLRDVRLEGPILGPVQDNRATIFANMTYRAAICHEIAHAVLGHHNVTMIEGQQPDIDDHQRLLNAREREIEADVFGMKLHLESLPHPAMMETAAAALIYNVHGTSLLRYRLMFLAEVVNTDGWPARVRHPDPLYRFASLVGGAESWYGADVARLMTATHYDLEAIDGEIRECHLDQRDSVREEVLKLATSLRGRRRGGLGPQLDGLLSRSPVGVIRGHDLLAQNGHAAAAAQLVEAMPRPVQRFVVLSFGERPRRVLNQII
jgi:hypothetical protein